jgi:ribosomal protein S18 acetylase RimI-like enzyme
VIHAARGDAFGSQDFQTENVDEPRPMSEDSETREQIVFRLAKPEDLPAILHLLADDPLGKYREQAVEGDAVPAHSRAAFDAIVADPRNRLIVLEVDGAVAGCMQVTFIPGLTYQGRERALIEGVRVANAMRGRGLGKAFMDHAIGLARERGCALVQLTTDKRRAEAQAFYRALGFTASHEGMKLWL